MKIYASLAIAIIIILPSTFGCTYTNVIDAPVSTADATYSEMILGTWWGEYDLGNVIVYGETTYDNNQKANGFSVVQEKTKYGNGKVLSRFTFSNKWDIKKGILITYDITSEPISIAKAGDVIRDKIIEMTPKKAIFISLTDNSTFYRYKKN